MYVLDGSCLIAAGIRPDAAQILELLGDAIRSEDACFPDEVLDEVGRLARDEVANAWVKAVAPSRCHKGASYKFYGWVSQSISALIDEDAEHECSAAATLAQARELSVSRVENAIVVVTEDIADKPTRLSLASACDRLEMPRLRLDECLGQIRRTIG